MFSGGETMTSVRWAVDTSVAVAALDSVHAAHLPCREIVRARRPALAGHAAFETFSVLTRMPGSLAVDGPTAAAIIQRVFPEVVWPEDRPVANLRSQLGPLGIVGGAVYDALVATAASSRGCRMLTRDLRARRVYDLLGLDYELVGP